MRSSTNDNATADVSVTSFADSSTWAEAVHIATLRDECRSKGLDASVRSLAREFGCSHGRAGELLKMYDAFSTELILLGKGNAKRGEAILRRLSYRQFRELLKIDARMTLTRAAAVRRMLDNDAINT